VDYRANVANELAANFYHRHGVQHVGKAFEHAHAPDACYMRTKYCLKHELGYCPKKTTGQTPPEPLYLLNNGKKLRLTFDCKHCEMIIGP
jgi:putative protease